MEVAFGTVGVASIVLQLVNSIQQLCDFISSLNSAPIGVRRLQDELRTLRAVLLPIEQYRLERSDSYPLGESLKFCQSSFDRLNETVQGWQKHLVSGGTRRTWGRLSIALGKKKVEEFKYELESAKILVLLALQPIYHKIQCQDIAQPLDSIKQLTQSAVPLSETEQTPIAEPPGRRMCRAVDGRKRQHLRKYSIEVTPRSLGWYLDSVCREKLSISSKANIIRHLYTAMNNINSGVGYSKSAWLSSLSNLPQKDLEVAMEESYQRLFRVLLPGFTRGFSVRLTNTWGSPLDLRFSPHNVIREDASIIKHVINGDNNAILSEFRKRTASIQDVTLAGGTLLHYAACHGRFETCQILLRLGVDPNALCSQGRFDSTSLILLN